MSHAGHITVAREAELQAPTGVVLHRFVRRRSTDKSVRDRAVTAKLSVGQIIVENKINGVLFSFPAAVWPLHWNPTTTAIKRLEWVTRLTPWWDMEQPQWSPTSQRLRESCVKAINNLLMPLPLKPDTANGGTSENMTRRTGVKSAHDQRCVESPNDRADLQPTVARQPRSGTEGVTGG